jgi:hypothetical protein
MHSLHSAVRRIRRKWRQRKAVCISLDSDNEGDVSGSAIKKLQTLALPSTEVPSITLGTGWLNVYFPSVQDSQWCAQKLPPNLILTFYLYLQDFPTEICWISPNQCYTQKLPPEF